jgi:hypothetical protein
MEQKQYIKPAVMQLDFSTDEEVVSFSSCKTSNDTTGSNLGITCDNTAVEAPCNASGNS